MRGAHRGLSRGACVACSGSIGLLEREYRFWQEQRAVNISLGGPEGAKAEYSLNRYSVPVGEPR